MNAFRSNGIQFFKKPRDLEIDKIVIAKILITQNQNPYLNSLVFSIVKHQEIEELTANDPIIKTLTNCFFSLKFHKNNKTTHIKTENSNMTIIKEDGTSSYINE